MTEPTLVSRDNTDFEKQRIKYQSVELNHEQLCDAYQRVESIVREIAAAKQVDFVDASGVEWADRTILGPRTFDDARIRDAGAARQPRI